MSTFLIVYASSMGNTLRMAEAMAMGAQEAGGTETLLRAVDEVRMEDVRNCDALALGSPVRHGNVDSRLRHFIESACESLACRGHMADKLGAVFTVGGHSGRGDGGEVAQLVLLRALAAAGMTLVTAPNEQHDAFSAGPCWGPHARVRMQDNGQETLDPDMLALARAHGRRIAQLAQALRGALSLAPAPRTLRWPSLLQRLSAVFR